MQQMYSCPNCGSPVAFGAGFCTNCGISLSWPTQQQMPPPPPYQQQQRPGGWGQGPGGVQQQAGWGQGQAKEKETSAWLAGCLVLIAIAVLVGVVYFVYDTFLQETPPAGTGKRITITYSSSIMESYDGAYGKQEPGSGYTYLVLNLDIENQGYESFAAAGGLFSVVVNNVEYGCTSVGLENTLGYVDVLDGGRISGGLAFEVPAEVSSAGYEPKYYQSWYNIAWVRE